MNPVSRTRAIDKFLKIIREMQIPDLPEWFAIPFDEDDTIFTRKNSNSRTFCVRLDSEQDEDWFDCFITHSEVFDNPVECLMVIFGTREADSMKKTARLYKLWMIENSEEIQL